MTDAVVHLCIGRCLFRVLRLIHAEDSLQYEVQVPGWTERLVRSGAGCLLSDFSATPPGCFL